MFWQSVLCCVVLWVRVEMRVCVCVLCVGVGMGGCLCSWVPSSVATVAGLSAARKLGRRRAVSSAGRGRGILEEPVPTLWVRHMCVRHMPPPPTRSNSHQKEHAGYRRGTRESNSIVATQKTRQIAPAMSSKSASLVLGSMSPAAADGPWSVAPHGPTGGAVEAR